MSAGAGKLMKFLFFALCLFAVPASGEPRLELISSYEWSWDDPIHGGYSGLHVYEGGEQFVTVSDRGDYATGRITRSSGKINGVGVESHGFLKPVPWANNTSPEGRPAPFNSNSEGLAVSSDGAFWVAFEGFHRLRRFEDLEAEAEAVENHPDFPKFQSNSGLEVLAIDDQDRLYTLPERSGKWTRPFQVYRRADGAWSRWTKLPRRDRFLPTGGDIGPDGKFYLLERRFEVLQGFATRIRRFDVTEQGFTNEVEILKSPFRQFGNTEGLSVWKNSDGELRLTLITDDNFSFLQSTQLHEFRIID